VTKLWASIFFLGRQPHKSPMSEFVRWPEKPNSNGGMRRSAPVHGTSSPEFLSTMPMLVVQWLTDEVVLSVHTEHIQHCVNIARHTFWNVEHNRHDYASCWWITCNIELLTAVKAEVISKILHVTVSASYSSVLVSRQMLFDEAVV